MKFYLFSCYPLNLLVGVVARNADDITNMASIGAQNFQPGIQKCILHAGKDDLSSFEDGTKVSWYNFIYCY